MTTAQPDLFEMPTPAPAVGILLDRTVWRPETDRAAVKESLTDQPWREVTEDEFFRAMGPLDVTPCPTGRWPYTSLWKTRQGSVIAKSVDYLTADSGLPKTRYLLPNA